MANSDQDQHYRALCDGLKTTTHHSDLLVPPTPSDSRTLTPKRRGIRQSFKIPPHVLAQRHNNVGVRFMESGDYNDAISNFIKAFKYSRLDKSIAGEYSHCSLKISSIFHFPPSEDYWFDHEYEFIYKDGVSIPQECLGHFMGPMFQVLLSCNLALAEHLLWAVQSNKRDYERLGHIRGLYKLAYNSYLEFGLSGNRSAIHNDYNE